MNCTKIRKAFFHLTYTQLLTNRKIQDIVCRWAASSQIYSEIRDFANVLKWENLLKVY